MTGRTVQLPSPVTADGMPLAQALSLRRSMRKFVSGALALSDVGQLLWSAQGITSRDSLRTAPSASSLYPLEIHLAAGAVEGLDSGVRYVHMEVDHAAQNVFLQATAFDLHCVVVGAFNDDTVRKILALPTDYAALCLLPLDHPLSKRQRT